MSARTEARGSVVHLEEFHVVIEDIALNQRLKGGGKWVTNWRDNVGFFRWDRPFYIMRGKQRSVHFVTIFLLI